MPAENGRPIICVLGSLNVDLVVGVDSLPRPGQTVSGRHFARHVGGKGLNQAVAAARAGASVSMIGATGDDADAGLVRAALQEDGVDLAAVLVEPSALTGVALITVAADGENTICVVGGANTTVTPEAVAAAAPLIEAAEVLLMQLEVPVESVLAGGAIARAAGVKVVLDPAPAPDTIPDGLLNVDLICPNEEEASALTGVDVCDEKTAAEAAAVLHEKGAAAVAVTMGADGTLLSDGTATAVIPSINIKPVDTTAAGDSLAGATAAEWVRTGDLFAAVRYGNVAGALAATKAGARASVPTDGNVRDALSVHTVDVAAASSSKSPT